MGARWRPKKWVVVMFGSIALFLGAVAFVGCYSGIGPYDLPPKSRALDETLAVSKSLGLPMTQAELVGEIPPDDENAAIVVIPLAGELPSVPEDIKALTFGSDPVRRERVVAVVMEQSNRLDQIAVALRERRRWSVAKDFDLAMAELFPEYARVKRVAQFYYYRGNVLARDGRFDEALSDLLSARDLARRTSNDPTLLGMLVSIACDLIASRLVEILCDAFGHDQRQMEALEAGLVKSNFRIDARQAMRGEFYMALATARNFRALGGFDFVGTNPIHIDPDKLQRSGVPSGLFERASMTTMAQIWNEAFHALEKHEHPSREWARILDARTQDMESRFRGSEVIAKIMMPVYGKAAAALINHDVNQDIALAYARCFLFRARHQRWPNSLEAIDSAFPDPHSPGSLIRAKFRENELRIWSVGRDRIDDGGKIKRPNEKGEDTVFVWPPTLRTPPQK